MQHFQTIGTFEVVDSVVGAGRNQEGATRREFMTWSVRPTEIWFFSTWDEAHVRSFGEVFDSELFSLNRSAGKR
jgi:hypothetical protein